MADTTIYVNGNYVGDIVKKMFSVEHCVAVVELTGTVLAGDFVSTAYERLVGTEDLFGIALEAGVSGDDVAVLWNGPADVIDTGLLSNGEDITYDLDDIADALYAKQIVIVTKGGLNDTL